MRLSIESIRKLQQLILETYGKELTDEEAQQAGLKIIRFVYVSELKDKAKAVHENTQGL